LIGLGLLAETGTLLDIALSRVFAQAATGKSTVRRRSRWFWPRGTAALPPIPYPGGNRPEG